MAADTPSRKWYWEKTNPSRSSSSGDLSKLFKNESVKQPGVFSAGAPSADATLLAREVIQNSWDAAIELREDSDDAPPFENRFSFRSALAERKRHLIVRLGLGELAERLVVRHVIIFGYGHGLQRAIIDESQHRTPERLVMAQH